MDTSPEYIKMCEMAEEIQKTWNPLDGDLHILVDDSYKSGYSDIRLTYGITSLREERKVAWLTRSSSTLGVIWLPRQDQLQEMISPSFLKADKFMIIDKFLSFIDYADREWSFEQLWLAFVMKEKFFKIWSKSSGEWINENL